MLYVSLTIFYKVCTNSFIYRVGTLLIKMSPSKITAFIFLSLNAFYFIEHYIDLTPFNDRAIFFFLKIAFKQNLQTIKVLSCSQKTKSNLGIPLYDHRSIISVQRLLVLCYVVTLRSQNFSSLIDEIYFLDLAFNRQ